MSMHITFGCIGVGAGGGGGGGRGSLGPPPPPPILVIMCIKYAEFILHTPFGPPPNPVYIPTLLANKL